jgi:hypothetical protein
MSKRSSVVSLESKPTNVHKQVCLISSQLHNWYAYKTTLTEEKKKDASVQEIETRGSNFRNEDETKIPSLRDPKAERNYLPYRCRRGDGNLKLASGPSDRRCGRVRGGYGEKSFGDLFEAATWPKLFLFLFIERGHLVRDDFDRQLSTRLSLIDWVDLPSKHSGGPVAR